MSKIAEVKTHPISVPLKHTLWTAHEELKDSSVILVEVRTDDGIADLRQARPAAAGAEQRGRGDARHARRPAAAARAAASS
ncbi:MAG TPA: hypothetical protein VD839_01920 [Burkholderiales bacterium]|nr:hypothetical protein [Burkholderiales bacterium]